MGGSFHSYTGYLHLPFKTPQTTQAWRLTPERGKLQGIEFCWGPFPRTINDPLKSGVYHHVFADEPLTFLLFIKLKIWTPIHYRHYPIQKSPSFHHGQVPAVFTFTNASCINRSERCSATSSLGDAQNRRRAGLRGYCIDQLSFSTLW